MLLKAETGGRVVVIKYLHPVKVGSAQGLVGEIYAQIKTLWQGCRTFRFAFAFAKTLSRSLDGLP
jgi:hypothetical protein